ncbi:MAG: winged helix-turn-helix transcriptional regulator [Pseudorhodoplanes sp.]|nr:MAG: winged helix-turn-helix transcriptional regulator [Pseudorhodoplanes sp.]
MSRTRKKPSTSAARKSGKIRNMVKKTKAQAERDPSRIWTRPGFLIRRLHQIHCALFFEECSASTITPLQSGMLTVLTEHPDGVGIRELAFQLGTDHSTTADVARRLASRGYIKQHIPKTDRRKIVSQITNEGYAFLKLNEPSMQKSQDILLQPLTSKQRTALMSALRTLVYHYNDKGRAKLQL